MSRRKNAVHKQRTPQPLSDTLGSPREPSHLFGLRDGYDMGPGDSFLGRYHSLWARQLYRGRIYLALRPLCSLHYVRLRD